MINLLFISADPKALALKDILQPRLTVKVDVVGDFDHGLQNVIEKRPAAVIIQDHILEVAGESVARHIKMLLGEEAPRFILLYEGESKRAAGELFEYYVDLAHSEQELAEEIMAALERVFGEQWKNIVSSYKADSAGLAASATTLPDGRELADQMVADLLSDMESFREKIPIEAAPVDEKRGNKLSTSDEMAAMLIEAARQSNGSAAETAPSPLAEPEVKKAVRKPKAKTAVTPLTPDNLQAEQPATPSPEPQPSQVKPAAEITAAQSRLPEPPSAAPAAPQMVISPASAGFTSDKPASPADFRVSGKTAVHEPIPEELLLAFEANYRSHSRSWRRMVGAAGIVCVLGVAGWFLLSPKPHPKQATHQKKAAPAALPHAGQAKPKTVTTPAAPSPVSPAPPPQAPVSVPALPSFISPKGKDSSFAATKPGWERYVDSARDVRIFRDGGRIKAIQVMAGKGTTLKTSFIETVLQELVGSSSYALGSRERKQGYQGYLIQKGSVGTKAELIIYRKKTSDAIVAFVVSLN